MISTSRKSFSRKGSAFTNYQKLETVRRIVTIKAVGTTFVNGITNKYQGSFPKQLQGLADKQKYEQYMEHLNRKLQMFWPCCFAYFCGYGCAPLTLGLSLFIPKVCINQAEAILIKQIAKINRDVLGNSKLQMRLVKKCYDSCLVIQQRDFAQFELNNQITL